MLFGLRFIPNPRYHDNKPLSSFVNRHITLPDMCRARPDLSGFYLFHAGIRLSVSAAYQFRGLW
jgi:hypothetical protein